MSEYTLSPRILVKNMQGPPQIDYAAATMRRMPWCYESALPSQHAWCGQVRQRGDCVGKAAIAFVRLNLTKMYPHSGLGYVLPAPEAPAAVSGGTLG
jgi:hypothetical protein